MKKIYSVITLLLFVFLFSVYPPTVSALICFPTSLQKDYLEADAVYVGKVLEKHTFFSKDHYFLEADKHWEGTNQRYKYVTIDDPHNGENSLDVGKSYLVFATGPYNDQHIALCGRTKPVENAQLEATALGIAKTQLTDNARDLLYWRTQLIFLQSIPSLILGFTGFVILCIFIRRFVKDVVKKYQKVTKVTVSTDSEK